jgi:hypothetical protein
MGNKVTILGIEQGQNHSSIVIPDAYIALVALCEYQRHMRYSLKFRIKYWASENTDFRPTLGYCQTAAPGHRQQQSAANNSDARPMEEFMTNAHQLEDDWQTHTVVLALTMEKV